jgi:hypothetical protein
MYDRHGRVLRKSTAVLPVVKHKRLGIAEKVKHLVYLMGWEMLCLWFTKAVLYSAEYMAETWTVRGKKDYKIWKFNFVKHNLLLWAYKITEGCKLINVRPLYRDETLNCLILYHEWAQIAWIMKINIFRNPVGRSGIMKQHENTQNKLLCFILHKVQSENKVERSCTCLST